MMLLLVLLFFVPFRRTATYYIGCSGSGIGTIDDPFNSPNDIPGGSPGDSFLFKRGCVWSEPLYLYMYEGTSGTQITFGAYGSGDLPLFSGYTSLNELSWQHHSGNIYYASTTADFNQILVNRDNPRVLHVAHYPSTAPYENGFFTMSKDVSPGNPTVEVVESSTFFSLPDTYIGPGTVALFKVRHWSFRAVTIESVDRSGESFVISSVTGESFGAGYGFFLMNRVAFMEQDTWVYDSSSNRLYVWLAEGVSPADASVDVFYPGLTGDVLMQCWNCKYVTIENLRFRFSGGEAAISLGGDTAEDSTEVYLQDNVIEWANNFGVVIHPSSYLTIRRNTVLHSLDAGITIWGGAWPAFTDGYGHSVYENTITGVGEWGGMIRFIPTLDITYNNMFPGLIVHGTGHSVFHNTVSETGRDGIGVNGQSHHIYENYVHHIGSVVCDVGMYYLFGPNHVVERNIGEHCYRNTWPGTPENGEAIPCHGLYTDGNGKECYDVIFRDNVIQDVSLGVHLYVSRSITIEGNLLFNTWSEGISATESSESPREQGWACCHTMEDNVAVSAGTMPPYERPVGGFYSWEGDADNTFTTAQNNLWYGYNTYKFVKADSTSFDRYSSLSAYQSGTGWDSGSEWINVVDPATGTSDGRALEDFTLWTNPSTTTIQVSTSGFCDVRTGAALPATSDVSPYAGLLVLNCGASPGPDCSGLNDCSSHGICTAGSPDWCDCDSGWTGSDCSGMDCPGSPDCSSHGTCTAASPPFCVCDSGYSGSDCGTVDNCSPSCSSHGTCQMPTENTCSCDVGWTASTCDTPVCDSISCVNGNCGPMPNECTCDNGYTGTVCDEYDCSSLSDCSSNGECSGPGVCTCDDGYAGDDCSMISCSGIIAGEVGVCSDHGDCQGPDDCNCDPGWHGDICNHEVVDGAVCDGIPSALETVCHGRGTCRGTDICECDFGFTGQFCEIEVMCDGISALDDSVCNGNGLCTGTGVCVCDTGYEGDSCESSATLGGGLSPMIGAMIGGIAAGVVAIIVVVAFVVCIGCICAKKRKKNSTGARLHDPETFDDLAKPDPRKKPKRKRGGRLRSEVELKVDEVRRETPPSPRRFPTPAPPVSPSPSRTRVRFAPPPAPARNRPPPHQPVRSFVSPRTRTRPTPSPHQPVRSFATPLAPHAPVRSFGLSTSRGRGVRFPRGRAPPPPRPFHRGGRTAPRPPPRPRGSSATRGRSRGRVRGFGRVTGTRRVPSPVGRRQKNWD